MEGKRGEGLWSSQERDPLIDVVAQREAVPADRYLLLRKLGGLDVLIDKKLFDGDDGGVGGVGKIDKDSQFCSGRRSRARDIPPFAYSRDRQ